jgi:hypothetical protein
VRRSLPRFPFDAPFTKRSYPPAVPRIIDDCRHVRLRVRQLGGRSARAWWIVVHDGGVVGIDDRERLERDRRRQHERDNR